MTSPRPTAERGSALETATSPPASTRVVHRVGFYQTDAMGIMHHANYLHLLETARVRWLEEHHESYRGYVEAGLHFAVTRVDVEYRRAARFDDTIETRVWLEWIRGASLAIAYELHHAGELLARARTEHAMVDATGRPVRIPAERRRALATLARQPGRPADPGR